MFSTDTTLERKGKGSGGKGGRGSERDAWKDGENRGRRQVRAKRVGGTVRKEGERKRES